jgi:hypothetical protein
MVTKVKAIYEKGAVYRLEPVDWPEHSALEIQVAVAPSDDRLGQLLREAARLGPLTPENLAERQPLLDAIRAEMFKDSPEVGTEEEELAKLLGFDPNDEEKMAELAEEQAQAIQISFPIVNDPKAVVAPANMDAIIYSPSSHA